MVNLLNLLKNMEKKNYEQIIDTNHLCLINKETIPNLDISPLIKVKDNT
jgi:hypothetical protein